MKKLSHLNDRGEVKMVNVSAKPSTSRTAIARGKIHMDEYVIKLITTQKISKGNVIVIAKTAGIMAAKRVDELIPLCHTLPLDNVNVDFEINHDFIAVTSTVHNFGKTGVEMEALTAVSVACLTIYDMCKAVDKNMSIGPIYLLEKHGGRSGHYVRERSQKSGDRSQNKDKETQKTE